MEESRLTSHMEGARERIAIIGTGMAGLITAHLLETDKERRFDVQVFEIQARPSLDSASVTVSNRHDGISERIDVPMRAFTGGYYHNLKAMYDFIGVRYRVQPFVFHFSKLHGVSWGGEYFIHASNNHKFPPTVPQSVGIWTYLTELVCLFGAYLWFTACCLLVPAREATVNAPCESFDEYIKRVRLSRHFVSYYLLPLMSAVTTCSHQALLDFPAHDIVEYRRQIATGKQYVVADGVQEVQNKLTKGLSIGFCRQVLSVEPQGAKLSLTWRISDDASGNQKQESFDKVIFAVPPDVVASIFSTLRRVLSLIPTTPVTTIVHQDMKTIRKFQEKAADRRPSPHKRTGEVGRTQHIYLQTVEQTMETEASTEAIHEHDSGFMVTSCPLIPVKPDRIVRTSQFTRVLRTPKSRLITNSIFEYSAPPSLMNDEKLVAWRNGDSGVFLVGSWCWDGMVLLEGCVVSASRVARSLGVEVPWDHLRQG